MRPSDPQIVFNLKPSKHVVTASLFFEEALSAVQAGQQGNIAQDGEWHVNNKERGMQVSLWPPFVRLMSKIVAYAQAFLAVLLVKRSEV